MPAVHLSDLTYRHSSAVDILTGVTAHLGPGWTAVVGANGAGKTTLLRLIAGELGPIEGSVTLDPGDAIVVFCRQEVEQLDGEIADLGADWDGRAARFRGRLDLDPADLDRWDSLSPGERKRWQIGAALGTTPDVLLLDEPTNHLDAAGREWLLDALARFRGVGVVVSHDRTLLETLTTSTLRIHGGVATLWSGSYEVASGAWTAAAEEEVSRYRRLRREQEKLDRRIADRRRTAEAKRAAYKRRIRTAGFKDIDARSTMTEKKFREGEAGAAKVTRTTVKARDRLAGAADEIRITKELGGSLFVDFEPSPKADLVVIDGALTAGDHVVLGDTTVAVGRNDRVWLRGANGVGKTTLLHALRDGVSVPRERVLFLPQEITASQGGDLLDRVRALPRAERGRVLAVVAALGVDPDVLLASERPSPGEVRKLAMASGLGRQAWLLLLDEPTNHLDLPSIERLETALVEYPGAMVVVTHDDFFGSALDLTKWHLEGGRIRGT